MSSYTEDAREVIEDLPDDVDASVEDVATAIERYVTEYDVPQSEAKQAVQRSYGDGGEEDYGDEDVKIGDLGPEHDEQWFNLTAEVLELWEDTHESIAQKGLLGDDTGKIVFTTFENAAEGAEIEVEEGTTYRFESVVGDEYDDELNVKLTSNTTVETVDRTFEPPSRDVKTSGAIVTIQSGSGLVRRRVDDGRVVREDPPDVETEFDLRIKAVLDDGEATYQVLFDSAATEALTGIDIEEAKEMSRDALDVAAVREAIENDALGRYVRIEGRDAGQYVLVDRVVDTTRDVESEARDLLAAYEEVEA